MKQNIAIYCASVAFLCIIQVSQSTYLRNRLNTVEQSLRVDSCDELNRRCRSFYEAYRCADINARCLEGSKICAIAHMLCMDTVGDMQTCFKNTQQCFIKMIEQVVFNE
ncbi:hypothetical protein Tcan_02986 [Toxocara canis]|uniref:Uncharacterized protein n=1 Tax=Toxocara canis TaxID=6265 RepID=A0A0B2VCP0_TOXCA|nr:hypothetical protein Tcan_02986 [Toxocara canis]